MSVTAQRIRDMIVAQDAARPRSQQRRVGPSDLSSPCDRQLVYKIQQVEPAVSAAVNLYAWVGTQMHNGLQAAAEHDTLTNGGRWICEVPVSVPITDTVDLRGSCDAYDGITFTALDWKSRGANKPTATTRDKHHRQILPYALGLILLGHRVDNCAVVYLPRNGTLADIEVDVRPFDHDAAEAVIRRYRNLLTVSEIGPSVLPILGTADDCRFCPWWNPNAWIDNNGCTGHQATPRTPGDQPAETQPNTTQKEVVSR